MGKIAPYLVNGAFFWLFTASFPILGSLAASWHTEEYSHGFLIPPVAFLLGWHRLTEKKPRLSASWAGIPLLLVGAALMIIGKLSAFEPPSHYGFLLSLTGLILACFGPGVLQVLAPALVFLIFAVPLPRLIYVELSQELQLWSSALGVLPLHMLGIPVFQDGNIIDLGNMRLQVAEACSGLRYLFPLMSFGYLAACLLDDKPWKRALIFLSTIPIAIGINALRIAIIGISVDWWGSGMAEGLLHDMEGWTLFLLCLVILALETWLLLHIGRKGRFRFEYLSFTHGGAAKGHLTASGPVVAALLLCMLLESALGTGWIDNRTEITPNHPAFATFPERIGDWSGRPVSLERQVLNALQASDYWLADYRKSEQGVPVDFYMAYYNSQRIGTSVHSPSNCLPGSGWVIANSSLRTLPLPQGGSITLSRLLIRQGGASQLVYYWFDERGRILTEQYGAKWHLLWDSIFMHRTDGALVRLVTPLGSTESEADADKRLEDFFTVVYPQVRTFIPGKNANAAPNRP